MQTWIGTKPEFAGDDVQVEPDHANADIKVRDKTSLSSAVDGSMDVEL